MERKRSLRGHAQTLWIKAQEMGGRWDGEGVVLGKEIKMMEGQGQSVNAHYEKVAAAIGYLQENFRRQPSLEEVAEGVHLSPYHFQRVFTEWAGVSPKKFLQYVSLGHAKGLLREAGMAVEVAAEETGLSGMGRLHDLFVKIEGMTPGEYKNGGAALKISYSYGESPFGEVLVGSTGRGVCHLGFVEDRVEGLAALRGRFPNAVYREERDGLQEGALGIFGADWGRLDMVRLHLKGTDFQLKVWEALLSIPRGGVMTYGAVAERIGRQGASRAVGTAIGDNPVGYLIPCHRVIRGDGMIGGYRWGGVRKMAMLGMERVVSSQ